MDMDGGGRYTGHWFRRATNTCRVGEKIQGWLEWQTALCNVDTAVFSMVMQLDDPIINKAALELGIQWALDSLPTHVFDTTRTTNRMKNIFTGISHGATAELLYLMSKFDDLGQGGTLKFWKNFGVYVSVDHGDNGYIGNSEGWSHVFPIARSLKLL